MKEILLVALGAALSYLATTVAEKQKNNKNKREEERAYILRAKLGLQSFNAALGKLKDGFSYRNLFEILRVDTLDAEISNLQFIKLNIDKFPKHLQEKLLILLGDADLLNREIRGVENFWASSRREIGTAGSTFSDEKEHEDYFGKQRNQKLIDLIEIKRRLEDLLRDIV